MKKCVPGDSDGGRVEGSDLNVAGTKRQGGEFRRGNEEKEIERNKQQETLRKERLETKFRTQRQWLPGFDRATKQHQGAKSMGQAPSRDFLERLQCR